MLWIRVGIPRVSSPSTRRCDDALPTRLMLVRNLHDRRLLNHYLRLLNLHHWLSLDLRNELHTSNRSHRSHGGHWSNGVGLVLLTPRYCHPNVGCTPVPSRPARDHSSSSSSS